MAAAAGSSPRLAALESRAAAAQAALAARGLRAPAALLAAAGDSLGVVVAGAPPVLVLCSADMAVDVLEACCAAEPPQAGEARTVRTALVSALAVALPPLAAAESSAPTPAAGAPSPPRSGAAPPTTAAEADARPPFVLRGRSGRSSALTMPLPPPPPLLPPPPPAAGDPPLVWLTAPEAGSVEATAFLAGTDGALAEALPASDGLAAVPAPPPARPLPGDVVRALDDVPLRGAVADDPSAFAARLRLHAGRAGAWLTVARPVARRVAAAKTEA